MCEGKGNNLADAPDTWGLAPHRDASASDIDGKFFGL
jgi:hypothetical protein